jgi:hypothetical protein
MTGIIFSNLGLAANLTAALLAIFTVLGGTMSLDPPRILQWFNYLSPIKYAIRNVSYYCLRGLVLNCTEDQRMSDGTCPIRSGEEILELYRLKVQRPWLSLLAGLLVMFGFRFLVFVILRFKVRH